MIEFVALKSKTYPYLMGMMITMLKRNNKMRNKKRLKFNNRKDCLLINKIILELQQRFKSEALCVYTEEITN